MGFDIAGIPIVSNAGGITFNNTLDFNAAGQGSARPIPGYAAWKGGGSTYYAGVSGWELNTASWQSSLNLANGVFTCPVAGIYAMGYNGIHRGGGNIPTGLNTYGYSAFAKNGAMAYHTHWNMGPANQWNTGGASALFQCAAGDTLALFVNRSPSPVGPDCVSQNFGLYPDTHHCVWCKLVG